MLYFWNKIFQCNRHIQNGAHIYKILLVDDDPVILENNQTFFRSLGYEVICAKTAETAEEIISSNALDCVILDVDLPGENGFGLCEKIRMKTGFPIVFLSGYAEEESRVRSGRALQSGSSSAPDTDPVAAAVPGG